MVGRLALFEEFFHDGTIVDFGLKGSAIEQVQGLREVGIDFDFAGANGRARGAAKGGQKIVGSIAVGNFDGPRAAWQSREFVLGFGDLADAIEEDFGADASDGGLAKVAFVGGVRGVRVRAKLIGARGADITDNAFEIVFVVDELGSERRRSVRDWKAGC